MKNGPGGLPDPLGAPHKTSEDRAAILSVSVAQKHARVISSAQVALVGVLSSFIVLLSAGRRVTRSARLTRSFRSFRSLREPLSGYLYRYFHYYYGWEPPSNFGDKPTKNVVSQSWVGALGAKCSAL